METEHIFKITSLVNDENQITADLSMDADSEIFKGHFPGQPVVPGACILQLVQNVLKASRLPFRLKKADYLKFMVMITPTDQQGLQLKLTHKPVAGFGINVTASLVNKGIVCFKFQGLFIVE